MTKLKPAISRFLSAGAAALAVSTPALAQSTAPSSGNEASPSDQIVQMSAFEVTTTQGTGYVATNAASALKTNESIMDIPQGVTVMSRDLIDDIGFANSSEVLQFFGLTDGFSGESLATRGGSTSYAYVDDMPENQSTEDDAYIDSYEVIKGPAEVLYVNARQSGIVLKSTKKPLPFDQYVVTAQINGWGQFRFTADFTGPIGVVGGAKLGYRVVLVGQGGGDYFQNLKDDRKVAFINFEVLYHNTTVRVDYVHHDMLEHPQANDIVTPGGALYTGAGRTEIIYPPNMMVTNLSNEFSAHVLQKISDNWESKFQASIWTFKVYGGMVEPVNVNWTGPIPVITSITVRLDNIPYQYWTVMDDFHGSYKLGSFPNQDAFGFAYSDYTADTRNLGWPSAASFAPLPVTAAAINAVRVPQWQQYNLLTPASVGSYAKNVYSEIYWQHTVEPIPNWLTLVGGWTWDYSQSTAVTNLSNLPWIATDVPVAIFLHRIGAVLKPIKGVSLYALEAGSFTPPGLNNLLNGQLAPPQVGTDDELGMKTSFLGGKVSTDFAWFHMTSTNNTVRAPNLPNGYTYSILVGNTVEEGVDGDVAFALVPGWQLIGNFYAGHDRDYNNNPLSGTYDNDLSLFTRYDFSHSGPLKGLSIGGGLSRVGGKWITSSQIISPYPLPSVIKFQIGTLVDTFANYQFNRHFLFKIGCNNILNQAYPYGNQTSSEVDPSPPRTWVFSGAYKF